MIIGEYEQSTHSNVSDFIQFVNILYVLRGTLWSSTQTRDRLNILYTTICCFLASLHVFWSCDSAFQITYLHALKSSSVVLQFRIGSLGLCKYVMLILSCVIWSDDVASIVIFFPRKSLLNICGTVAPRSTWKFRVILSSALFSMQTALNKLCN